MWDLGAWPTCGQTLVHVPCHILLKSLLLFQSLVALSGQGSIYHAPFCVFYGNLGANCLVLRRPMYGKFTWASRLRRGDCNERVKKLCPGLESVDFGPTANPYM